MDLKLVHFNKIKITDMLNKLKEEELLQINGGDITTKIHYAFYYAVGWVAGVASSTWDDYVGALETGASTGYSGSKV
jgi:hypothetical protein